MSQSITYKTKFKNLDDILEAVEKLIDRGVFGKDAKLHTILDDDFQNEMSDSGRYYRYPEGSIKMKVSNGGDEYFKEGFFDKGFAIGEDAEGNIALIFDYNSSRDTRAQKTTEGIKQDIEAMLEAGSSLISDDRSLTANGIQHDVNAISNTEYEITGTITEAQIKQILGN